MTRRDLFKKLPALAGIPFVSMIRLAKPKERITILPFVLFPSMFPSKPGDDVIWHQWPYWDVSLSGTVKAVDNSGGYKYIVVSIDEQSQRKLDDKTRYPLWSLPIPDRYKNLKNQNTYSPSR